MITTAEQHYFVPTPHELAPAELAVVLHWRDPQTGVPKFDGTNMPRGMFKSGGTTAHISWGRWCADCFTSGCHFAQYVTPADPRMWCPMCENAAAGGKWVKVHFPPDRERIEELLNRRPLPDNRIWYPFETIKDLERENEEHGVDAS